MLALMAKNFRVRPAEYVGITDPAIAFYFDVECNEALIEYEQEQEARRFEAIAAGGIASAFGGGGSRSTPEITEANFRDQAF